MKISELIEELNRLKDEHGDLEVKYEWSEYVDSVGYDEEYDVVNIWS